MKFVNHGLDGEFKGYLINDLAQEYWPEKWPILPKRPSYEITQSIDRPLYFIDSNNRKLTTRRIFKSDFSSVPAPFDRIWSPSEFRLSGMIHDDGCRNVGLWRILDDGSQVFIQMSRLEMDKLMAEMAPEECKLTGRGKVFGWVSEHILFWGVRLGSYMGIGKPDKVEPVNKIDHTKPPIAFA